MKMRCPSCGHEVEPTEERGRGVLLCPLCEEELPSVAELAAAKEAEEILPGLRPGHRLGAYEVSDFISAGGMAVVVKGKQLSLNRTVAIKVLPKRFTRNAFFIARFESEAAALAELNHTNIVGVIDRGKAGDFYFIVMEYVYGEDLRKRLARTGPLKQSEALGLMRQVLGALQYAHDRGIIHRDIKPANIMVTTEGLVKVADFGLAHLTADRSSLALTHTGQTMGTLKYMAPEQLMDSKAVDARSDLYSAGVVLYELLTAHLPVGAFRMPTELVPELDHRIDEVVVRALRNDPAERFPSAREFAAILEEIQSAPLVTAREAQQREFAAEPSAPTIVRLAACRRCGHESGPEARACENCGASLDHLFESCPTCGTQVRLDIPRCPSCTADLKTWRSALRREVMERQSRVKHLVASRQYEEALSELHKLDTLRGPEYEQVQSSARIWIPKVEKRLSMQRQQTYDAAKRMLAESHYEKALELLGKLPSDYGEVGALTSSARQRIETGTQWRAEADKAAEAGDREGSLALYRKAAEVWPHDVKLRNTLLQLEAQTANKKMAGKYLDEAQAAAEKENYGEAIELCRRAAQLAPAEASIADLLQKLQEKEREALARQPSPLAKLRRRALWRRVLVATVLIAAAAGLIALYVELRPTPEELAARDMGVAEATEKSGDLDTALSQYLTISEKYAGASAASKAGQNASELARILERCRTLADSADAAFDRGEAQWPEAGKRYLELIRDPLCQRDPRYVKHARSRLAEMAGVLFKRGKKAEEAKQLPLARATYQKAIALCEHTPTELVKAADRVQGNLVLFEDLIVRATQSLSKKDAASAEAALVQASGIMPSEPRLPNLIHAVLAQAPPEAGMVYIPPGEFVMGADDGDPDEAPRRKVVLERGFYMDIREVTNAQYMEFVQKKSDAAPPHWHDSRPPAGQEEFPVVNVTWAEAAAYAAWKGKRLPLETEWERAARGTNGVVFPWGNTWNASAAALQFSPGPVGTREEDVSPAGCRDMAGNVAEWTADAWEKDAAWQVVKGGSWAGPEPERVIRPVFAEPAARTDKDILFVLIDSADRPVLPMLFERNVYITFRGFSGSRERADVVVTKWLPDLPQWVSSHFVVKTGNEIGMPKQVAVRTDEGALRPLLVDFSTGCMLTGFKPEEEPVMLYTDPGGLARQLPREREPKLEAPPMLGPLAEGGATGKGWHALKDIPRGANRLKAPAEGRFANVGFRCAKTPRLLTLIPTAPPDSTRPGHGSSPPPADREARPAK